MEVSSDGKNVTLNAQFDALGLAGVIFGADFVTYTLSDSSSVTYKFTLDSEERITALTDDDGKTVTVEWQ